MANPIISTMDSLNGSFRSIPFDIYPLVLPSYYWLDNSFTICYRFISFPRITDGPQDGRLLILHAANPTVPSFDEQYSVEYVFNEERLSISFLNTKYSVESLHAHQGDGSAVIMHLVAEDGQSRYLYSVATNPFDPIHKTTYGIV